jgi:hypothetical protein
MRELEVNEKTCGECAAPMQAGFFVYVSGTERHDRWLESKELVGEYCERCFRHTPRVTLFIEFFCPTCGDYTGIYMECTPYSKAHLLTEISANSRK